MAPRLGNQDSPQTHTYTTFLASKHIHTLTHTRRIHTLRGQARESEARKEN